MISNIVCTQCAPASSIRMHKRSPQFEFVFEWIFMWLLHRVRTINIHIFDLVRSTRFFVCFESFFFFDRWHGAIESWSFEFRQFADTKYEWIWNPFDEEILQFQLIAVACWWHAAAAAIPILLKLITRKENNVDGLMDSGQCQKSVHDIRAHQNPDLKMKFFRVNNTRTVLLLEFLTRLAAT